MPDKAEKERETFYFGLFHTTLGLLRWGIITAL
jgi:hypothetical protein